MMRYATWRGRAREATAGPLQGSGTVCCGTRSSCSGVHWRRRALPDVRRRTSATACKQLHWTQAVGCAFCNRCLSQQQAQPDTLTQQPRLSYKQARLCAVTNLGIVGALCKLLDWVAAVAEDALVAIYERYGGLASRGVDVSLHPRPARALSRDRCTLGPAYCESWQSRRLSRTRFRKASHKLTGQRNWQQPVVQEQALQRGAVC